MPSPFNTFDSTVEETALRIGAELRGTSSGGGRRIFYLRADEDQAAAIIEALRRVGVEQVEEG